MELVCWLRYDSDIFINIIDDIYTLLVTMLLDQHINSLAPG